VVRVSERRSGNGPAFVRLLRPVPGGRDTISTAHPRRPSRAL